MCNPERKIPLEEQTLQGSGVFWAVPDEINELFELPLNDRVGADCWRRCSPVVAGPKVQSDVSTN